MKPKWKIGAILLSVLVWTLWQGCAWADKRVALIVGNSSYVRATKLINPENDAQDLAEALRKLNFEVILKTNVDKRGLDGALEEFERKVNGADTALFFFAGHGLQYHGRNFLLPTDADLEDEVSLRYNTLAIDDVRDALAAASGVKIMILDACRDNPLAKNLLSRSSGNYRSVEFTRGLARLDRAEGMVIAYATQADQVAQDGAGRNSPFSSALIHRLLEPNLEIATLFRRVAQDVYEQTGGKQRPELSISLLQDFYLNLHDDDVRAWRRLGPNAAKAELNDFIEKFPDSPLTRDARNRLYALEIIRQEAEQREEQRRITARNEACAREADQINRLAGDKQKIGLEQLKPQITCPGLAASIDAALTTMAAAEERNCADENRTLQKFGKGDVEALKAFLANANCDAARRTAGELVANIQAETAKQESACQAEARQLAVLRSRPAALPQLRSALTDFQTHLTCASLRTDVARAIDDIAAQEQQNLDKVRMRLAKLEEENRKFEAEAAKQKAACQAEAERLAAIKSKPAAAAQLHSELTDLQSGLTCASLKVDVAKAIDDIAAQQQQNEQQKLDKVRARLAAIEEENRKSEAEAAKQKVACQAEAERLAAIKSKPAAAPQVRSELKDLQIQMTCASLKADVAKAIDAVEAQQQQNLEKVKARLAAIEEENRNAESEAAKQKAVCQAEEEQLAAIRTRRSAPPLLHSELTQFQLHLTCVSLRADVAKAIKNLLPPPPHQPD